jgi:hypothetical protein
MNRRLIKAIQVLTLLVLLCAALIAAYTHFVAIPRFEEVARTGRVR